MQDIFPLHLIIFILARLVSTQISSHFSGPQLPLTVLLSITTFYHQTVAAAPLPPTTLMSLVLRYLPTTACAPLQFKLLVCGNITSNISDSINITLYTTESTRTDSLHPIENQGICNSNTTESMGMNNLATTQLYIIFFSNLATALFVGAVASSTVIVIFLKRSKAKIRAASVQSNNGERTTHNEQAYGNVIPGPLLSASAINTHDNVAYGHTKISTRGAGAIKDVPMYEEITNRIS